MDRVEKSRGNSWEQVAEWALRGYLAIPLGREDYEENRDRFDPAYREIADELIESGIRPCSETWLLKSGEPA
jgi:hypothetical protein